MSQPDLRQIDIDDILVFVHRDRDEEEHNQITEAIKADGQKVPIQVRDISHLPIDQRRREDGKACKWGLIVGEGRILAHRKIGRRKIWALIIKAPEIEIVGRFLAENIQRKALPWAEKARLIKDDVDAGMSIDQVAVRHKISPGMAHKYVSMLRRTAPGLEQEVAAMPVNDAEVFTALSTEHQGIVVEVARETGEREIRALVRKARELTEEQGTLSVAALRQSLQRLDADLKAAREKLKLLRLHHQLGPENLRELLGKQAFRVRLKELGVNLSKFEAAK